MKNSENIYLIGYRGAGKSSVAKQLSKLTGRKLISMDQVFIHKNGPIANFIEKNGWQEFRRRESDILHKLPENDHIIDCGGGVIESAYNREFLHKSGYVFWLKAAPELIFSRIEASTDRPSLTGNQSFTNEIESVLRRRCPLYELPSHFAVSTDAKSPDQIASEIVSILENKSLLCVPVAADSADEFIEKITAADKLADIIELRIDSLPEINQNVLEKLIKTACKPVIVTCRPKWEGGGFIASEKERIRLLHHALDSGAASVDIEFRTPGLSSILADFDMKKIILSWHDFTMTPPLVDLQKIYSQMVRLNPALVKIVTTATGIQDNFKIFRLLKESRNLISFCMGINGQISRVLTPKYGGRLSFGTLDGDGGTAAGQFSAKEMAGLFHFRHINAKTSVFGVIGSHAEDSQSKFLHNLQFYRQNRNAVYLPLKVTDGNELQAVMQLFRKFHFSGCAVTIPHKESIRKFLDGTDELADRIGAVNTVVNDHGQLTGYNTDWTGAVAALMEITGIEGKSVLVLGAGGAARAVVFGVVHEGGRVMIANRTPNKAAELATASGMDYCLIDDVVNSLDEFDIIINTTSLGMYPHTGETPLNSFPAGKVVMDIVYRPLKTQFIQLAEKAGCKIVTGEKMLIHQAAAQQRIWGGGKAAAAEMAESFYQFKDTKV